MVFVKSTTDCCQKKRIIEIDLLRGVAVLMMVIFHFLFFLNFFKIIQFGLYDGFMFWYFLTIPILFIGLSGISMSLSNSSFLNGKKDCVNQRKYLSKSLKRGLFVFGMGLIITLLTYVFYKEKVIIFGILHLIGFSIIIGSFLIKYKFLNLIFGILSILFGAWITNFKINSFWFVIFGVQYHGFRTFDYYPIFPWIGVFLCGIFLGKILYVKRKSLFSNEVVLMLEKFNLIKILSIFGRKSLIIYFLHVPFVLCVVYLITLI